jgi:hypothetical protein
MAGDDFDPDWANTTARYAFIFTIVGVVLFVGAVYLFIH